MIASNKRESTIAFCSAREFSPKLFSEDEILANKGLSVNAPKRHRELMKELPVPAINISCNMILSRAFLNLVAS